MILLFVAHINGSYAIRQIIFVYSQQREHLLNITIRVEQPSDTDKIHDLTTAAFLNAPHTDHTEQFIVKALRESGALTISLVAELVDENVEQIVGHVAISPIVISDGYKAWYGLGPISVEPRLQGKGIGSKLMRAAIDALKEMHANGCVVLGDPDYYSRFGFKVVDGLVLPDVPPEYFMALSLGHGIFEGDHPQGEVTYHPAFAAVD